MPRCARLKEPSCTYHIMVRSISEVQLYNDDDDKDRFLKIVKKYQDLFIFKIYAYCIMDTHAHFIIYSNGSDISKIMHGINQSYAQYYNRKYGRHGHLFQDRFKSKIIDDESYLISLSGYIHNNPSDIIEYKEHIENYPYSSLGIYMGIRRDNLEILDDKFILKMFSKNLNYARRQYMEFVKKCTDINNLPETEFVDELTEYRSQKSILPRDYDTEYIAKYLCDKMGVQRITLSLKHNSRLTDIRALFICFLRSFCDLKYREICKIIGNVTQSRASKLCSIGIDILQTNNAYREMFDGLINKSVV